MVEDSTQAISKKIYFMAKASIGLLMELNMSVNSRAVLRMVKGLL
jgi:hypothetical protein